MRLKLVLKDGRAVAAVTTFTFRPVTLSVARWCASVSGTYSESVNDERIAGTALWECANADTAWTPPDDTYTVGSEVLRAYCQDASDLTVKLDVWIASDPSREDFICYRQS